MTDSAPSGGESEQPDGTQESAQIIGTRMILFTIGPT
jgi:hypothetical protein